jgi:type II restriction/modification system DNA methylase subunit YeeA
MNTNTLKIFAQETRKKLLDLISAKLRIVLSEEDNDARLLGREKDIEELKEKIEKQGESSVIEEVAYTWFNRIMALRFMDANSYTNPKVVTPSDGAFRPEILQDALSGSISEELSITQDEVNMILEGGKDIQNPQAELYRRLLVAECNRWGKVMPFLFEKISDYTELLLPDDLLSEMSFITDIREGMSDEDCQDVEIVGWLYQFYVSEENARLISSKKKYNRNELAPASQLFTPEWIVRYMVDNTLGQYWSELYPDSKLLTTLEYYIKPENPELLPHREIKSIEDIKFYDPCVGSAHILSYAYDVFYKMYEELGYSNSEIPFFILQKNLWGTDIDPRAAQLSSFVLTMKARKSYRRFLRNQVITNISYYKDFNEDAKFSKAASLGSLINISENELNDYLSAYHKEDVFNSRQDNEHLTKLYQTLGQKYDLVVTNPPYISSSRVDDITKKFMEINYKSTKSDLFATFIIRCLELCNEDGFTGYMTPFVWMFISSYEKLREELIKKHLINNLIQLEYSGFDGATVPICTFTLRNKPLDIKGSYIRLSDFRGSINQAPKTLEAINNRKCGWFFTANQKNFEKIPGSPIGYWVSEKIFNCFSDKKISNYFSVVKGLSTGCVDLFMRYWFEVQNRKIGYSSNCCEESLVSNKRWFPYMKGGSFRRWNGNLEFIVNWKDDGIDIKSFVDVKGKQRSRPQNTRYYFREGITYSALTSFKYAVRYTNRSIFGGGGDAIFTTKNISFVYLIGFLNSKVADSFLRVISPTMNYEVSHILGVPLKINLSIGSKLIKQNITISKLDWDSHETSWDFRTSPLLFPETLECPKAEALPQAKEELFPAQDILPQAEGERKCAFRRMEDAYGAFVDVARRNFFKLHENEVELNRQFIGIYGLEDELTPDVPLDEVTILQQGEVKVEDGELVFQRDVVVKQFISYLVGCFMGRYSLERDGLIIADSGVELVSLDEGLRSGVLEIDDDGIIPVLDDEYFHDELSSRVYGAVERIFGREDYLENVRFMEGALGKELRRYMDKDFYKEHVQRYKKRPIYWCFSSAKGTFKALVYMHRYKSDTLSKLLADYVQPFISILRQKRASLEELILSEKGSTGELNKARKESEVLRVKLLELDDFQQRLLEAASHRISIDLDDGVRVNYPKFEGLVVKIVGMDGE